MTKRDKKGRFIKGLIPDGSILFVKGGTPWNKNKPAPRGADSTGWKGGRTLHQNKYWLVYTPHHPMCDNKGYVREHRLVVEKSLGRILERSEIVHHRNGDTLDNSIDNLEIVNRSDHMKIHHREILQARWQTL